MPAERKCWYLGKEKCLDKIMEYETTKGHNVRNDLWFAPPVITLMQATLFVKGNWVCLKMPCPGCLHWILLFSIFLFFVCLVGFGLCECICVVGGGGGLLWFWVLPQWKIRLYVYEHGLTSPPWIRIEYKLFSINSEWLWFHRYRWQICQYQRQVCRLKNLLTGQYQIPSTGMSMQAESIWLFDIRCQGVIVALY